MQPPPGHKEIQEFKFNRLCNLRIFPSNQKLSRKDALSVVSTSNKFGLIFAGTPTGLQCIPVSSVFEQQTKRSNNRGTIGNYNRREVNFGQSPSHVAVNSSGDLVGVVILSQACPVLLVYVVQTFAAQDVVKLSEIRLSSSPGTRVLDLHWNPAIPNTIGVVLSDGSAMVVEINLSGGAPTISAAPATTRATCLCWSPKGKQVAIGSSAGSLAQYKPDLNLVKSYNPPQIENAPVEVVSLHWISSFQFIAVYKLKNAPQARSFVVVVNVPKNGPQSFINYEDICFGTESLRHEHYFIHLAAWNLIILSTGNALEASVLHQEGESWVQWLLDDVGRAELPQTDNHEDVFTVGMALNLNASDPIPIGDHMTAPPMPLLLMMSEEGVLSLFHTMNLLPDCPQVCTPAQDLPKHLFSVPEAGEPASQIQNQPQQLQHQPQQIQNQPQQLQHQPQQIQNQPQQIQNQPQQIQNQPQYIQNQSQQMQNQSQQMLNQSQQMQNQLQQIQNQPSLFQNQPRSQQGTPISSTISTSKPGLTGEPTSAAQQGLTSFSMPAASPFQMSPGFGSLGQGHTTQSPFQLNTSLNIGKAPNFGQFASTPPVSESPLSKPAGQAYLPQKPPAFQMTTPTSAAAVPGGLFGTQSTKPTEPPSTSSFGGFGTGSPSGASPSSMPTSKQQVTPSPLAGLPVQTTAAEQPPVAQKAEIQAPPPPSGPPPIDESVIINEVFREFDSMRSFMSKRSVDRTNYNRLRSNKTLFAGLSINLNEMEEFEKELRDTTSAESAEVKALRNRLLELWGWVEIAKAKDRQANSSRYLDAFESKDLDSTLKELMKNIDQNSLFIETKIKQLENHLLNLWQKYKEPGSIKSFDIPNMEAIYQTLSLNCRILALQQARIKEQKKHLSEVLRERSKKIPRSISDSSDKWKSYQWSANNDSKSNPLEKLANKLLATKIESQDDTPRSFKETSKQYIALSNSRVRKLSASKEASLWEWHKSHKLITTKVSRMPVPDNEVLNSSRLSAISTPTKASDEETQRTAAKTVAKNLFAQAKPSSIITSTPLSSNQRKPAGEKVVDAVNPKISNISGNVHNVMSKSGASSIGALPSVTPFTSNSNQLGGLSSLMTPVTTPKFSLQSSKTSGKETTGQAKMTSEAPGKSPTTSSSALFNLLSGSTVTVAATEKDKSLFGSTPPSSMFGNTQLFESPASKSPTSTVPASIAKSPSTLTGTPDVKAFGGLFQAKVTASTLPSSPASQTVFSGMSFAQPKTSPASNMFGGAATNSSGGSIFNFASLATTTSGMTFGSTSASSAASPTEATKSISVASPIFSSPQPVTTQVSSAASSTSSANAPARSSPAQAPAKPAVPTIASSFSFGNSAVTPSSTQASTTGSTFSFAIPTAVASSAPSLPATSSISSSVAQPAAAIATVSSTQSITSSPQTETVTSSNAGSELSPPTSTSAPAHVLQTPPKSESMFGVTVAQSVLATPTTAGQQTSSIPSTPVTSSLSTPQTQVSSQIFKSPSPGTTQTTTDAQPMTTPSSQPMFGTPPTSTQSMFGTSAASTQPVFGTPTSSVSFGTAISSGGSVFSSVPNTPTSSVFGTPTTSAQTIFGASATSSQPTFGTPTAATNQPLFGAPTTTAQPAFGSTSLTSQQPGFGQINFGSATNKLPFGTPTTPSQQPPLFGSPAATSAQQTFGTPATAAPPAFGSTPTSSVFGSPTPAATTSSSSSVFGASNLLSNTSFFGSPSTTASTGFGTTPAANIFGGSSGFSSSQTSTTTANIFGQAVCSPNVATTPSNTANPFGSPFGQKTTFGGSPALGTMSSPGAFGSSGGSLFGGSSFGQPSQQGNIFQSNNASPSVFGTPSQSPGAFSGGNQSAQSGFGGGSFARSSPTQPVFGGQATFGSAPTFGGTPGFGSSPTKPFGAAPAPTSFGTQSSTFENLANQNTVSFGNLAQSTPPSFGASSPGAFGQPQQQQQQQQPQQQQQQQQQQQPFSNAPVFGGSSFSSWR